MEKKDREATSMVFSEASKTHTESLPEHPGAQEFDVFIVFSTRSFPTNRQVISIYSEDFEDLENSNIWGRLLQVWGILFPFTGRWLK